MFYLHFPSFLDFPNQRGTGADGVMDPIFLPQEGGWSRYPRDGANPDGTLRKGEGQFWVGMTMRSVTGIWA